MPYPKQERITLRCNGYRYRPYTSVGVPLFAKRCEHEKKFLPRQIAAFKHTKDDGDRYPYVDLERQEYHCLYCAGAFRLLQATEERLRKQWAETHPTENFPRIRSVDDLRELQAKLTDQGAFESKKPIKKIRGKDLRKRKLRRETARPPASLRGLCGLCDRLLFSYKMSRPIKFHQECLWQYQREHGADSGPRKPDGTFTAESSKPIPEKSRRGAPVQLESLQKHFAWSVRHHLLNESYGEIAKNDPDNVAKNAVVEGIEFIMKHLPPPEWVPTAIRDRVIALRSI